MSGFADLRFDGLALEEDAGLETAVVLSFFTDRRANPDDSLPGAPDDRRGWWGDAFPPVPLDRIGSRLWLLVREKQTHVVVQRAQEYGEEALQWLVDDGIASRVVVIAVIYAPGILGIHAAIHRPSADVIEYRYHYAWEAQSYRKAA